VHKSHCAILRAGREDLILAGFLLKSFAAPTLTRWPLKVLDLGGCEITGQFQLGNVRGAWAYFDGSSGWRITKQTDRILLIEGQPDRFPSADESIERWLEGRSGSFRGFEVRQNGSNSPNVLVFTDPLGTRPVYLFSTPEGFCVSDKLASIAINCSAYTEPDWRGLLESAALGALYSHRTTIKEAQLLPPGEAIELKGCAVVRRWKNTLPIDASLTVDDVQKQPAETLKSALTKAIAETWTNPEARLLLSGGLDSRILLVLAAGKRKALTVEMYSDETEVAKKVASVSGVEQDVVPAPDYEYPMRWSYLVTGVMHDSRFCSTLGLVEGWRKQGIAEIVHGYFHNTMYRGWTARPFERFPTAGSILFEWMGRNAYYFDRYGCMRENLPRQLYDTLSVDGQIILKEQLRQLADSIEPVIVDGFDLTFERRLLGCVSRQVYFGGLLSWYEAVDVASPVFHPAVWSWYAFSRPKHRDRDWAIREVFLNLHHPAAKLPDSSGGFPGAHLKVDWRDRVRNQFWYPPLRNGYQKLFPRPQITDTAMRWGTRLRQPQILGLMEDALTEVSNCALFDGEKVRTTFERYRLGDDELVDAVCALTALGQWVKVVRKPESLTKFLHEFQDVGFVV
jgi:hypothetical protein